MKSGYQKALKFIAVITIIIAILIMIVGVLLIIAGGILGSQLTDGEITSSLDPAISAALPGVSLETVQALETGFGIFGGIAVVIVGLILLIVGGLGKRGANNPRKIGPFFVLSIISLICSLLYILMMCFGAGTWEMWLAAGLDVLMSVICVALAAKIRGQVSYY